MYGWTSPPLYGQHTAGSSENSLQQPIGCKLLIKIMSSLSRQQTPRQNSGGLHEPAEKVAPGKLVMLIFLPGLLFPMPVAFKRSSEKPGCGCQSSHPYPGTRES